MRYIWQNFYNMELKTEISKQRKFKDYNSVFTTIVLKKKFESYINRNHSEEIGIFRMREALEDFYITVDNKPLNNRENLIVKIW